MKKLITILLLFIAFWTSAQIDTYNINAGQWAIYDSGSTGTSTVERKYTSPGVIAYRNHVSVVDTIVHVPATASLDTLSNFTRPTGKIMGIGLQRGGEWRSSIIVPDDSIVYYAYGSGAKPIINGADNNFTWTPDQVAGVSDTIYATQSSDDGYIYYGFTLFRDTHDYLRMGLSSGYESESYVRFPSVALNQGASVTSAKLLFTAYQTNANSTNLNIEAEDVDNSATITSQADAQGRARTSNTVTYSASGWYSANVYESSDISSVVNEVVSRPGWQSGNAITIFINNVDGSTESYNANSFDNDGVGVGLILTSGSGDANNNIYSIPFAGNSTKIIEDGTTEWTEVATRAELTSDGKFFINTVNDSISIYSNTDPSTRSLEITNIRANGIYVAHSNVTVNSIESRNHSYSGVRFIGNESNAVVNNCSFFNNGLVGLQFYGGYSNSTAQYCYSEGNGNGFYADTNADGITFKYNTAYDNSPNNTDGHGIGIYDSDDCVIEYNTCTNNGGGIVVDPAGNALGVTVRYNYMADNDKADNDNFSLGSFTTKTAYVHNNIMVNDRCMIMGSGSGSTQFYNNTLIDTANTTGGTPITIMNASDKVFRNNIFYSSKSGGQMIYIHSGTLDSDYNLFYAPNTTMVNWNGVGTYNSLSAWQTASSQDANSYESLPEFVDAANKDFTPITGSPAINAGTDAGLTQDILGNPIVGTPDIGAVEKQ